MSTNFWGSYLQAELQFASQEEFLDIIKVIK
jgi:hypothetical protein